MMQQTGWISYATQLFRAFASRGAICCATTDGFGRADTWLALPSSHPTRCDREPPVAKDDALRQILTALLSAWLLSTGPVLAAPLGEAPAGAETRPLEVAIKVAPPFVIDNGDGSYDGLAIELWEEAAADHGWRFHYREYDLDGLLNAVSSGKADVGIGAITVTADREQRMDFSHPITSSGLGVAVQRQQNAGWLAVARAFFSLAFLKVAVALTVLLLAVGLLTWVFERKRNPEQFGGKPAQGIGSGFWWAAVTMTTVGYGDKAPVTAGGRILGLLWMFAALIVVSTFTAAITSALTVGQLSTRIRNADDLAGVRVATLADTTSAQWLAGQKMRYRTNTDLDTALSDLAAGKSDAVVYDAPLLRWTIAEDYRKRLEVLPFTVERQDYAYALPTGSRLREPLNASLLERINAPDWRGRVSASLGDGD